MSAPIWNPAARDTHILYCYQMYGSKWLCAASQKQKFVLVEDCIIIGVANTSCYDNKRYRWVHAPGGPFPGIAFVAW